MSTASPEDVTAGPRAAARDDPGPAVDVHGGAARHGRPRHVRSFVMRRGHLSDAQRDAHASLLPRYGVPDGDGPIDFAGLFGRRAPVVLEIGFGMGHTTAEIAAARPDTDFVGIEVYTPGVGSLLRTLEARGLGNVRVIQRDAVEVLRDRIAPGTLAAVHVYFPDPWPKTRHHKRRLIQPPFVAELAARLAPGGYLHCATDWAPYAEQMLEVLSAEPLLANTADGFAPRPDWRPLTKFERRGLRLGHGVWDLMFIRRRGTEETPA
jgi:tRNA (guanine-N7-)-methyltransferase